MRERELQAMLSAVRRILRERYLSLRGLAGLLGLSAAYLSMVLSGKRRPGSAFVRAVLEHLPEVRMEVADSLRRPEDETPRRTPH
ncbi:MAG: helix-turn-helix domain-containing protein [Anaerolineae bacterium]